MYDDPLFFFLPCKNSFHVKKNKARSGFSYHAKNPCHVKKNNVTPHTHIGKMNSSYKMGEL